MTQRSVGTTLPDEHRWPGGIAVVTVEGNFLTAEGASTAVELHVRERQPDGSLKRAVLLQTFRAPGEHRIAVPAGVYFWSASGPEGQPWEVRARLDEPPKPASHPTLTDRVEALEARLGKAGLDA